MLSSIAVGDRIVLTADTEELRQFALQQADDKEAFALQRKR